MRAVPLTLFSLCLSCTLVIDGRIDEYEGACTGEEEEAATARYNERGEPTLLLEGSRSIAGIAADCPGCATEDCVEECILDDTNSAITLECAACFADATACVRSHCRVECDGEDARPATCDACGCAECGGAFEACSGLAASLCR
jgi:hypothetical protein